MLHITNGDIAANTIRRTAVAGNVLPWREMWLDGPFMSKWWLPEAIEARADYFERAMGIPRSLFMDSCKYQLNILEQAVSQNEGIVLWFEHDLYDQAMLAAILYRIADDLAKHPGMLLPEWIVVSEFSGKDHFRGLGQLTAVEMASLWPQRKRMAEIELQAAAAGWEAYVNGCAARIAAWIEQADAAVPLLAEAFRFYLEMLPSGPDGLGIVERTTLQLLAAATEGMDPMKLFKQLCDRLPLYGAGDLTYWSVLERMAGAERPLLSVTGSRPLPKFMLPGTGEPANGEWNIALTNAGQQAIPNER